MLTQAIILCGGLGTRLGHLTAETPKPLLNVGSRPFLDVLLFELGRHGFRDVVLLASYQAEKVFAYAKNNALALRFGFSLSVIVEPEPAGTGGALYNARHILSESFLLLNGDSWLDANLLEGLSLSQRDPSIVAVMALRSVSNADRYGIVSLNGDRVISFGRRSNVRGKCLINAGIYMFRRSILAHLSPRCSLENDVLPVLCAAGIVAATTHSSYFVDIGVPKSFEIAQQEVPRRLRRPAVFFDRDGVLNVDQGYVGCTDRFRWIDGAIDAVNALNCAGYLVFVVTNQAGVARGYYRESDVTALHDWMQKELRLSGAHLDDIRYCPFHPDGIVPAYRRQSTWRKPEAGMILDLCKSWEIDMAKSHLVGDKVTDLEAGGKAGVTSHLFVGGNLLRFLRIQGLLA